MPLYGSAGQRIGYAVHPGPPGAPALLLLHGFTASSASFVSNVAGLSERFTVITAELLGHGDSDAPDDPALYTPDAAIARLLGLLDELGLERVLLCGHSLGGALALRLALEAPDRLAGLIVLNSNSAAGTPDWRESARASMREMAQRVRAEGIGPLRNTRLYPAQGTRLPQAARRLLTRDFDRLQPSGVAGTAESLVVDVNAFERLGELQVPALIVIGDRDNDFARNAPRFIAQLPPDLVETFTIEGAGHAANLEQPDVFNGAVIAFAERIGYLAPPGENRPGDTAGAPDASAGGPIDDEDLGPTIYEEIAQAFHGPRRDLVLGTAGTSLIVLGAGLIAAAFLLGRGGGPGTIASAGDPSPTATRTIIEQSAGVRTAGPGRATASVTATVAGAQPVTSTPTALSSPAAPTAAATATPTDPAPAPTATPIPPEPTPTVAEPTATPSATPTPSGPSVAILGPDAGPAGAVVTFTAATAGNVLRQDWSASNGQSEAIVPAFSVTFGAPGCHSVTLTVIFASGETLTATHRVAIGGATCD